MVGPQGVRPGHKNKPSSAIHGGRLLYGLLLALIAICSVAGVVGAAASGQTTVAIAIGIIALAFFSRVGC